MHHMQPDYHEIMDAEYNRNARIEAAANHRLLVEAGVYADRREARQRMVNNLIARIKQVVVLIKSPKITIPTVPTVRETSEFPAAT